MTKKKMKKEIRRAKEFYAMKEEEVQELARVIRYFEAENSTLKKSLVSCENALHEKETIITYLETKVWDRE